jgi:hypothetical protein
MPHNNAMHAELLDPGTQNGKSLGGGPAIAKHWASRSIKARNSKGFVARNGGGGARQPMGPNQTPIENGHAQALPSGEESAMPCSSMRKPLHVKNFILYLLKAARPCASGS